MKYGRSVQAIAYILLMGVGLAPASAQAPLIVGRKDFLEQDILCEILRQHLALRLKAPTTCADPVRNPDDQIRSGKIDLYVEYNGTAYSAILKRSNPKDRMDSRGMTEVLKREYPNRGLLWLEELGFDDSFVMVIRLDDAKRFGAMKLSEIGKAEFAWRVGAGPDFQLRDDGLRSLLETYPFKLRARPITAEPDVLFRLLQARAVDMIAANSTDPRIDPELVQVLEDDLRHFPTYRAAVVLRSETARRHPAITSVLGELTETISADEMRRLLGKVQHGRVTSAAAATEFLQRLRSRP
jgi:glycine betaine/choline ABC-type transport system substrate-binding protein